MLPKRIEVEQILVFLNYISHCLSDRGEDDKADVNDDDDDDEKEEEEDDDDGIDDDDDEEEEGN